MDEKEKITNHFVKVFGFTDNVIDSTRFESLKNEVQSYADKNSISFLDAIHKIDAMITKKWADNTKPKADEALDNLMLFTTMVEAQKYGKKD